MPSLCPVHVQCAHMFTKPTHNCGTLFGVQFSPFGMNDRICSGALLSNTLFFFTKCKMFTNAMPKHQCHKNITSIVYRVRVCVFVVKKVKSVVNCRAQENCTTRVYIQNTHNKCIPNVRHVYKHLYTCEFVNNMNNVGKRSIESGTFDI